MITMPFYSWELTVNPGQEVEFAKEIEGNYITHVRVRFPPGPMGLLKVAFYYGIKQIFPYQEGTWIQGDNEIIEWDEWWKLPERKITLKIKAKNEDDTYSHTFYVQLVTKYSYETLPELIVKSFISILKRLLGWVTI